MEKIGELRVIKKDTKVWSLANQSTIITTEDTIVEITNICSDNDDDDYVFVKTKQLLFNVPGYIPTIIGKGKDEWSIKYSLTEPYTIPKPSF